MHNRFRFTKQRYANHSNVSPSNNLQEKQIKFVKVVGVSVMNKPHYSQEKRYTFPYSSIFDFIFDIKTLSVGKGKIFFMLA